MGRYIITIDQGTTSTKAFLLDEEGVLTPSSPYPITQHYPKPGYVEHDGQEIYLSVLKCVSDLLLNNPEAAGLIDSVAITNQRETTIAFSNENGKAICPAVVWQCRRTSDICRREIYASKEPEILGKTGLKLDPYFSATKMRWILENIPGAEKAARSGEISFGTVDGFLVYNLTGRRVFASDYSNCSRTMLFNIVTLEYDRELLELFDIPEGCLAEPRPSCSDFGAISLQREDLNALGLDPKEVEVLLSLNGIHITGVAGDQAAALFGQNCFGKGDTKTTYGTGCFTLMNIGETPVFSSNGLLTSASWSIGGKTSYALEGSVFQGGSVISWLKDEMDLISKPSECDEICMSIEDNGGVYLIPAFTGMGAPYWDPDLRGTLVGLTRGSGRAHIVRAGVESIAYQVTELVDLMMSDTGIVSTSMKVDGGVCASEFLMQLQADLLGVRITRAISDEMTAMGVGLMAGLTTGFFDSEETVRSLYRGRKEYTPQRAPKEARELLKGYKKAVAASYAAAGKEEVK